MPSAQFSAVSSRHDAVVGVWRRIGIVALLVAVLPSLFMGAATMQPAAGVRDAGNFFSPNAISRASDIIYDIHARFGKDLLVETFPTIPVDLKAQYDPQDKAKFFSQWAHERFAQEKMNGIYILICRDPSHFHIYIDDATADIFRPANQEEMRQALLNSFRERNYDQGLTDAAEYVRSTLTRNMAALSQPAQVPNPPRGVGFFGIVLIVLAVLVVLRLLATILGSLAGRDASFGPGPIGPGYGGGGFGRGMLGGLFGGLAGNWLYDRMFRGPADYDGLIGGRDFSAPNDTGGRTDVSDSVGRTNSGSADSGGGDAGGADDGGSSF
jgi:uncharacterized membrane protein YgcG